MAELLYNNDQLHLYKQLDLLIPTNSSRGLGNAVLALFGTFLVITEVSSKIVRWTQYSGSQGSVEQITRSNFTLRNLRTDIQVHASVEICQK